MTGQERVNSFADVDLNEFTTKQTPQNKPEKGVIDEVSEEAGFPSRQPPKETPKPVREIRRYRTGRNIQINVKVTKEAQELFDELVSEMQPTPQGEVFYQAMQALKAARKLSDTK